MLRFMERATIHYLKQKGWSNVQIAEFTGHHRETVAKVLKEPIDQAPKERERTSAIAVFEPQIQAWLTEQLPVIRMLEQARSDPDHPYQGSERAFYTHVRKLRRARQLPKFRPKTPGSDLEAGGAGSHSRRPALVDGLAGDARLGPPVPSA